MARARCALARSRSCAAWTPGYNFRDTDGDFPYRGKGIRIPLLTELLHGFPETPLNVEIKQLDPPIEKTVLDLLD
jgi:glycerophosphoryl diester phosphodiesterase